ncbi:hypothetical protein DS843_02850 [Roseomonas genomospecies 6]|uniref:Uncharacterized protein n=1 Tax=Roseomonas genomospecies 6 TaxID=214106 RepID=A0A9W7U0S1_9PROT|nr:hypothetical protein DS843_02850 [Roseomonas genomospecies 6]
MIDRIADVVVAWVARNRAPLSVEEADDLRQTIDREFNRVHADRRREIAAFNLLLVASVEKERRRRE